MLNAALKSIFPADDALLKPGASEIIQVLLAQDGLGRAALDELIDRMRRSDMRSATASHVKLLRSEALRPYLERVPLFPPRLHFCGPGAAGKTLLRHQLLRQTRKAKDLKRKEFYA
uniref:Uncharacterized protein n=1 Tax=Pinguiococcus pyrenoidosus TaxID=172671 RepID=A0A7R9U9E4_9STRA